MKRRLLIGTLLLSTIWVVFTAFLFTNIFGTTNTVRSKGPAVPLSDVLTPEQQLAQDLALSDTAVQAYTIGRPSEVFGVHDVGDHYPAAAAECDDADCLLVAIYNWDEDATVSAIVNIDSRQVVDVLYQPGIQPGINKRLAKLATELAINDPGVIDVLGFRPDIDDVNMSPMDGSAPGTPCGGPHLCVAQTFRMEDRVLWAFVDLTDETVAALRWTILMPDEPNSSVEFTPAGCPPSGSVNRDGWSLDHEVTGSDALRVYNVTFNGHEVLTSVKLVEWHADYGSSGFVDATGCTGGGGFPINPYGNTQILDLEDTDQNVIGFEVVQDFRMGNWGAGCNYRYEQHIQFFQDGRFRIVGGAFGRGCGNNALYRPLTRIDIAVDGDSNDSFSRWDGSAWELLTTETYLTPYADGDHGPHELTPENYSWRVDDSSGGGYYIEQDIGQWDGDNGRGASPFLYPVLHHANEGDSDMGRVGDCCNDDHQQGPEQYVNGESIEDQNIVLWYVPQLETDVTPGDYYCWTITGEPNPETYPCFAGPMFVPTTQILVAPTAGFVSNSPIDLGATAYFTNTTTGSSPITYEWDFGDGIGTSTDENPSYVYQNYGFFNVVMTATNAVGSDVVSRQFTVVPVATAPTASFVHNSPVYLGATAVFTNTTIGSPPLSYEWNFGDGVGSSTQVHPTYDYQFTGMYTVTLTATNSIGNNAISQQFVVLEPLDERVYLPVIIKP